MKSIDKLIKIITNIPRKIKANYIISRYNSEPEFISKNSCIRR